MGSWTVAILDSGVVDELEAIHGANAYEWDYYYGNGDTDGGRTDSHGTRVALTIEQTNPALDRIDMQIASNSGTYFSSSSAEDAFDGVIALASQGWNVGAVNLSWGGPYATSSFADEIAILAARGIFAVAASGNDGSHGGFETPIWPAARSNVIAVGSHDGAGRPSWFSNNAPEHITVLADGEEVPGAGDAGTSFAAPQVAAGVATVQALADAALERRLDYGEVVDVLRQGGNGPLSLPDPADGTTRYFLFDQAGSLSYFQAAYLDPEFSAWEYVASHGDIEATYGADPGAARNHFLNAGVYEGRAVTFDGLAYVASHGDLIQALGADRAAGALHYLGGGRAEGRAVTFDAESYLDANADLAAAFGDDVTAATRHYVINGFAEGRPTVAPVVPAISEGDADLPATAATDGRVGVGQSATGTITTYDRDWFATELTAGETVVIEARGAASGSGTLYDPDVRLYNAGGSYLTYDWDSGAGRDARLVYTPGTTGTHYVEVDGFSSYAGSYTVSVSAATGLPPEMAEAGMAPIEREGLEAMALDPLWG